MRPPCYECTTAVGGKTLTFVNFTLLFLHLHWIWRVSFEWSFACIHCKGFALIHTITYRDAQYKIILLAVVDVLSLPFVPFHSIYLYLVNGQDHLGNVLVKSLDQVNSKYTSLCLFLLPSGLSGTVCRPAQPANPSRAVQPPATQVLLRAPVGLHTDMQEHIWLSTGVILCSVISFLTIKNRYSYLFFIPSHIQGQVIIVIWYF